MPARGSGLPTLSVLGERPTVSLQGRTPSLASSLFSTLCAELLSSSFNKQLAYNRGLGQGGECIRKGVNIILGPVVAPQGRVVLDGRLFEGQLLIPDHWLKS